MGRAALSSAGHEHFRARAPARTSSPGLGLILSGLAFLRHRLAATLRRDSPVTVRRPSAALQTLSVRGLLSSRRHHSRPSVQRSEARPFTLHSPGREREPLYISLFRESALWSGKVYPRFSATICKSAAKSGASWTKVIESKPTPVSAGFQRVEARARVSPSRDRAACTGHEESAVGFVLGRERRARHARSFTPGTRRPPRCARGSAHRA